MTILQDRTDARARIAFLDGAGWENVSITPIAGDGSTRRYFRVTKKRETAILMESAPDGHPDQVPGHRIADTLRIGAWLRDHDLRTPDVLAADEAAGLLLLEDFGDVSFHRALQQGKPPGAVYPLAVDTLRAIAALKIDIDLPDYYDSHIHRARRRLVDWYIPALRRERNPDGLAESYLAVWDAIENSLPPCPQGFVHGDFHGGNLMWLPLEEGVQCCGLLDFQAAMRGPLPYDLANLLEDMRIDVPEAVRGAMLTRYCVGMTAVDRTNFLRWYRVLATQFHSRLLGQCIRWALNGKPAYLAHIPRLQAYMQAALEDPLLAPLRQWITKEKVDLKTIPDMTIKDIIPCIREDAV